MVGSLCFHISPLFQVIHIPFCSVAGLRTFLHAVRQRLNANTSMIPESVRGTISAAVDDAAAWLQSAAGGGAASSADAVELHQHEVEAIVRAQVMNLKMAGGKSFDAEVDAAVAGGGIDGTTPLEMLGGDLD